MPRAARHFQPRFLATPSLLITPPDAYISLPSVYADTPLIFHVFAIYLYCFQAFSHDFLSPHSLMPPFSPQLPGILSFYAIDISPAAAIIRFDSYCQLLSMPRHTPSLRYAAAAASLPIRHFVCIAAARLRRHYYQTGHKLPPFTRF